ncbi:hypothetical protein acsn021_10910 [Anaerocolumna cellulosilytica]|uniref:Uncharacterized protein n=1 Tax=Anaerocolumna cellulosilytica TaxID=433286 RepID=A0A6S6R1Y7_9FIRM|nr:hypothetical protein [Anaerocolumna cellulosilytica]MBB5194578.1 hypothetical protein [Anaerocolumna cellulosilytica]BCJ93522.1 hypothetical protein acsn021_10910 [Anaerocolumna cellulosilytica]
MKKKIIEMLIILTIVFMFTGCELEESGATLENETIGTIGEDSVIEIQEKDMTNLETNHIIEFNNIDLKFKPIYSIEKSRAKNWLFTQSSSINLSLGIEDVPDGINVMVSQVYSDISLLSKYAKYNGIRQDSINIDYHSLPTGGVTIRESDAYTMPFQVEGVDKSETFFYMYNGYGTSSTSRITESELGEAVQGAVLNVVWTILIEDESTGNLYIKTINDRVGIPYNRILKE